MEIVEVETGAQAVGGIQLIVEPSKGHVLDRFPGECTGQGLEVVVRGAALRRGYRRRASKRKVRGAGEGDGKHLSGAVVGEKIEQLVFEDRTTHAAAKLVLLAHGLRENPLGLGDRIEGVQRRITEGVKASP